MGYAVKWAQDRWAWEIGKLQRRFGEAPPEPETQFQNKAIEAAFYASLEIYDLAPWDGPVTLFRPPLDRHYAVTGGKYVSREREYVFEDNQWSDWLSDLTVIEVPGNHDSMVLEPNVRVLATRLRRVLDAAERNMRSAAPPRIAQAAE